MTTRTPPSDYRTSAERRSPARLEQQTRWRAIARRISKREPVLVALLLVSAAALRLLLAGRGWSYVNSDEGVWGLMVDDILWHGAHPIFLYGAHYMGALQTYLAAPFFVLFGPTNLALHITTTAETLLFMLILYLFTRHIYTPGVAVCALALLAPGPQQAIFYEIRAAAHAQDTLLFSALVLWLSFLRLRRPASISARLLLDLGIGLAAGVGLWCTFLTLPFILAAGAALSIEAIRRKRASFEDRWKRRLAGQGLLLLVGLGIGIAPFIAGNLADGGGGFTEMLTAGGAPGTGAATSELPGYLLALGQQITATLLVGLPHLLGSTTLCVGCPIWPAPASIATPAEVWRVVLLSAPFSLAAIMLWLVAALPLSRDAWQAIRRSRQLAMLETVQHPAPFAFWNLAPFDARWWGRAMLVAGGALTVLVYAASRSSYLVSDTSTRYLVGLYVCTPLVAAPLWQSSRRLWRWLSTAKESAQENFRPRVLAWLATALLISIFILNSAGAASILRETANRQLYGIPAGARDVQLVQFLQKHQATHFYTTYWACYRLMFAAQERVTCAVIANDNAFQPGYNRVPGYLSIVAAAPHPAYVFDLTTREAAPEVIDQLAARIASDPGFAGYTHAQFAQYVIYYYDGAT
jgi:hypothetical protein